MARPLLVGLTGGLACGKSTVLGLFAERGAATVDADVLARRALEPGSPLVERVLAALGAQVLAPGGVLDRAKIAAIVFADPEKRRALEAIVHPEVIRLEEAEVARHAAAGREIVVVDVPLLVEAGRAGAFDRLVVVSCPEDVQVERAVARGMAREDARRRVEAQIPVARKAALADYVIDTGGTLAETRAQAGEIWDRLVDDAATLAAGRPLARVR